MWESFDGAYDVVALPNWRSSRASKSLSFASQLGLDAGRKYVVFDAWSQELLGVFADHLTVEVDGHDTRVVLIYPLVDRPQLVGLSRHITGAFSIQELSWNTASRTLQRVSEVVPGVDYTLFVHLPPGGSFRPESSAAAGVTKVAVRQETRGDLLSVTFKSQQSPVAWQIGF